MPSTIILGILLLIYFILSRLSMVLYYWSYLWAKFTFGDMITFELNKKKNGNQETL